MDGRFGTDSMLRLDMICYLLDFFVPVLPYVRDERTVSFLTLTKPSVGAV